MGYRENYRRIREEYEGKARAAEAEAEARRAELAEKIPELAALDKKLSSAGLRILELAMRGGNIKEGMEQLHRENEETQAERAALLRKYGYPADYAKIQYACDRCQDTGYLGTEMCDCMRRRLIAAGFESSGMANLIREQNFDNFSLDYYRDNPEAFEVMKHHLALLKDYAKNFRKDSQSLLFMGGTGLGKTHLSSALAGEIIRSGFDVFYNSAVGLLSDFEYRRFGNGMAAESDDTAKYTECDLLIIDDLGTEVINQFTLSCLYYVLNTRLNMKKPTLISTNLSSGELRKNYSDRLTSRMMGEYLLIPFLGTDVRKQKLHS